jgi:hypothetical protein
LSSEKGTGLIQGTPPLLYRSAALSPLSSDTVTQEAIFSLFPFKARRCLVYSFEGKQTTYRVSSFTSVHGSLRGKFLVVSFHFTFSSCIPSKWKKKETSRYTLICLHLLS